MRIFLIYIFLLAQICSGASLNSLDHFNQRPLDYAKKLGKESSVAILTNVSKFFLIINNNQLQYQSFKINQIF